MAWCEMHWDERIYMYIYIYIYTHMTWHVCVYMHIYLPFSLSLYICIYIYIYNGIMWIYFMSSYCIMEHCILGQHMMEWNGIWLKFPYHRKPMSCTYIRKTSEHSHTKSARNESSSLGAWAKQILAICVRGVPQIKGSPKNDGHRNSLSCGFLIMRGWVGCTPGLHNKIPAQDFRQGLGCSGTHLFIFWDLRASVPK